MGLISGVKGEDALEARRRRIDKALAILKAKGKVEHEKGLALIQYNVGVSKEKAREYVQVLKDMGHVSVVKSTDGWPYVDNIVAAGYKEPKKPGRPKKHGRR